MKKLLTVMSLCSLLAVAACAKQEVVTFGHYEQDGNAENGAEAIEWLVLDENDEGKMLLAKYGLANMPYNYTDDGDDNNDQVEVTWESCTLRSWLNNEFLTAAFTADEQAQILNKEHENPDNATYFVKDGSTTTDQVYLLSIEEADQYFADRFARQLEITKAAENNGAYIDPTGYGIWWLRSPGRWLTNAAIVGYYGSIDAVGNHVNYYTGSKDAKVFPYVVRPVIWLKK